MSQLFLLPVLLGVGDITPIMEKKDLQSSRSSAFSCNKAISLFPHRMSVEAHSHASGQLGTGTGHFVVPICQNVVLLRKV